MLPAYKMKYLFKKKTESKISYVIVLINKQNKNIKIINDSDQSQIK